MLCLKSYDVGVACFLVLASIFRFGCVKVPFFVCGYVCGGPVVVDDGWVWVLWLGFGFGFVIWFWVCFCLWFWWLEVEIVGNGDGGCGSGCGRWWLVAVGVGSNDSHPQRPQEWKAWCNRPSQLGVEQCGQHGCSLDTTHHWECWGKHPCTEATPWCPRVSLYS